VGSVIERSGFFSGAIGTDPRYGTFTEYSGNANITYGNRSLGTLIPVDREGYYAHGFLDGTREYIIKEIDVWLDDISEQNVLWPSGSPGS
jgi:hypothetical protein